MAGWEGFSDEELRKLQLKDQGVPALTGRGRKPAPTNRSRQQLQREQALRVAARQQVGNGAPALPPEQQLARAPPKPNDAPHPQRPAAIELVEENPKEGSQSENCEPPKAGSTQPVLKELEKQEVELREKTRLEQLQQEQKMIEERNKRKKAFLTKTIAEKSKQTQQEAVKLKRIQKELQALDDMVSNDIGILRGRIEQASWDYSAARRRYEKAEAEYVSAKLDLHKKTDVKEQLTEHLCAIIQQNELRKAHKLEELMRELHLRASEEEEAPAARGRAPEEGGRGDENTAAPSPRDQVTTEEEGVTQGDCPLLTEQKRSEQNCKVVENHTPASVS